MSYLTKKVLVRREFFGATLFDVDMGHRVYINENEFIEIKRRGFVSETFRKELGILGQECLIIEPAWLPEFNFSSPDTVFFELTRACNAQCTHCFNNSGVKLNDEISFNKKIQVIKDLQQTGVQEIRFTGGEPLILREIYELLSFSTSLGLRNSIGTNATLLTKPGAKRLVDAGLHLAIVSIDGTEMVHNAIRGKDSFAKTMQGISFLQSCGIPVRVNAVVMRSNLADIVSLVEYFFSREIPLFLRRFIPSGRARGSTDGMLTIDEYHMLGKALVPYLEDHRNLVQGHYLPKREAKSRIKLPFVRQSCSAGNRGMVILPNGKVQTCGFLGPLGEQSQGTVPAESFRTIWKRLLISEHIQSLLNSLVKHNARAKGLRTNCFAIALATKNLELLTRKEI